MKLDPVTQEFVNNNGKDCSNVPMTFRQILLHLCGAALITLLLFYRWDYFLFAVTVFLSFWYLNSAFFKVGAAMLSLSGVGETRPDSAGIAAMKDEDLPVYTILLPLYKEANIAGKIIKNMERLDYPSDKLDIKLLLEADDDATRQAVLNCALPAHYELIIIPDFQPKTKPRACNFGLKQARGEFCVIYDAEDRPEPDQLKKAVAVFSNAGERLACVQAKLNYYNSNQNLLTRLFTIEYSTTFDLMLPGMSAFKLPLPLGGTSNHFRTGVLRQTGGWDPFNVTEDCDLGIRIYKYGYKTTVVDSTTWEEANSKWWNWIRQRSRWVKGFIQTHFTHMRHPLRTLKGLGLWGMFGFYLSVGASSFMMLINVFYWIVAAAYILLLAHGARHGLSLGEMVAGPHEHLSYTGFELGSFYFKAWPLFYYGAAESVFWSRLSIAFFGVSMALLAVNFMLVGIHALACVRRKRYDLLPYTLLMPFYWVMISIGAWKGFLQFFTKPFYWEKTIHGLDETGMADNNELSQPECPETVPDAES